MQSTQQRNEARKASNEQAYQQWLTKPETKLLLSMIPPSDTQEAMQVLLRSCFDTGCGHGEGSVALMMIKAMFKENRKSQD